MSEELNSQSSTQPVEVAPEEKKAAVKSIKTKAYTVAKMPDDNVKCPPQAKVIVEAIKELQESNGNQPVSLDELVTKLKAEGKLNTRQSEARIFGFYRPKLKDQGVLVEHTKDVEVPIEVKPKKAPTAKTAETNNQVAPAAAETNNQVAPAAAEAATAAPAEQVEPKKSKKEKPAPQTV